LIAVVMGVAGVGKTTVGRALAAAMGCDFVDGDDLHPASNVAKMSAGEPLTDADRAPWLAAVAAQVDAWRAAGDCGVVTCSALKRAYQAVVVGARSDVRLVYLAASPVLVRARMEGRRGHFMPVSLLESQFADLEPPGADERPIVVDASRPVAEIVAAVAAALGPPTAPPVR